MPLPLFNADTVAGYLSERGIAELRGRERIQVRNLSRRNHNLAVEIDGRPVWLVKQIQHQTPEVVTSLRREAYCYFAAESDGPLASLRDLMPRCAYFDSEHSILIMSFLEGINAADSDALVGPFGTSLARELGEVLVRVHRTSPPSSFPQELPWVLQPLDGRWHMSARSRFLALFHQDFHTARELDALRRDWKTNTIIHGDARPENFVLSQTFGTRLVDWELTNAGDPAWDCANVMQHYWAQWLSTGCSAPETWNALTHALQSFWMAYNGDDRQPLDRVTRFTGARLIQTAYEHFASAGAVTPVVERLVRLANLLLVQTGQALQGFEPEYAGHGR